MQAIQFPAVDVLRPARLNYAGWCMWCMEFNCTKGRCVELHIQSVWEVCPDCGGSGWSDQATAERCVDCVGGLTDVTAIRPRLVAVPEVEDEEIEYVVADPSQWVSGSRVIDPDYRPVAGMAHVPGWGL